MTASHGKTLAMYVNMPSNEKYMPECSNITDGHYIEMLPVKNHLRVISWQYGERSECSFKAEKIIITSADISILHDLCFVTSFVCDAAYIVYGPLLRGCTTVMYEGKPIGTPDAGLLWSLFSICRRHWEVVVAELLRYISGVDLSFIQNICVLSASRGLWYTQLLYIFCVGYSSGSLFSCCSGAWHILDTS